jgi:hypothetical protein
VLVSNYQTNSYKALMAAASLLKVYEKASTDPGSVHKVSLESLRGLQVWRVKGDGKCMWYALVAARAFSAGATLADVEGFDDDGVLVESAQRLRLNVCNELWDKDAGRLKQQYVPFWAPGEEGTEDAQNEREYVQGIWAGRVFGGELELYVASLITKRPIAVVNLNREPGAYMTVHSSDGGSSDVPIVLLRESMHYDAVALPRPDQERPQLGSSCAADGGLAILSRKLTAFAKPALVADASSPRGRQRSKSLCARRWSEREAAFSARGAGRKARG